MIPVPQFARIASESRLGALSYLFQHYRYEIANEETACLPTLSVSLEMEAKSHFGCC